jgi:hypothetical protein
MGWRDELMHVIGPNVERDRDGGVFVDYPTIAGDLLDMPAADRIAMARELLAGTGRVDVAASALAVGAWTDAERDGMAAVYTAASARHGHYETLFAVGAWLLRHRAAMMGDEP